MKWDEWRPLNGLETCTNQCICAIAANVRKIESESYLCHACQGNMSKRMLQCYELKIKTQNNYKWYIFIPSLFVCYFSNILIYSLIFVPRKFQLKELVQLVIVTPKWHTIHWKMVWGMRPRMANLYTCCLLCLAIINSSSQSFQHEMLRHKWTDSRFALDTKVCRKFLQHIFYHLFLGIYQVYQSNPYIHREILDYYC